jgi:hypothetical protein
MEGCEKGESQGTGRLDWIDRPQPLPILPNSLGLPAWAIALANKLARIAWEVLNKERNFECTRGVLRPFPGARRPESGAVSLWAGPWRLPGPTDRNRSARKRNRSLDAPAPKFRILKIHRAETGAEIRGLRCETSDIPRQNWAERIRTALCRNGAQLSALLRRAAHFRWCARRRCRMLGGAGRKKEWSDKEEKMA